MHILRLENTIIPSARLMARLLDRLLTRSLAHPLACYLTGASGRRWLAMFAGLVAAALLGGCGAVRLTYNNGPQLAWWWVDGYADFNGDQSPAVRQAIGGVFDWNRRTQLPDYASMLASMQAPVLQPTTPAAVCRWQDQVRAKLEPTVQYALAQAAALLPSLTEANFKAMEQQYAKKNKETRKDFLQADPEDRIEASVKRARENAERLYGDLDAEQLRIIRQGVIASPFKPDLLLAERQRRQRDTLQTLRKLQADKADADQRLAALRTLVQRTEHAPEPDYKAYQQKLVDYNCAMSAQIHNATTPAQREKARERLKGWEGDVRALAAQR